VAVAVLAADAAEDGECAEVVAGVAKGVYHLTSGCEVRGHSDSGAVARTALLCASDAHTLKLPEDC